MQTLRARLAAFGLIVGLAAMLLSPALTATTHQCGSGAHACCKGPKLAACCSTGDDGANPSTTPATPRVDIGSAAAALAGLPAHVQILASLPARPLDAPVRSPGLDLTTLLGSLRI